MKSPSYSTISQPPLVDRAGLTWAEPEVRPLGPRAGAGAHLSPPAFSFFFVAAVPGSSSAGSSGPREPAHTAHLIVPACPAALRRLPGAPGLPARPAGVRLDKPPAAARPRRSFPAPPSGSRGPAAPSPRSGAEQRGGGPVSAAAAGAEPRPRVPGRSRSRRSGARCSPSSQSPLPATGTNTRILPCAVPLLSPFFKFFCWFESGKLSKKKSCCGCFGAVALLKTSPWVEARAARGAVGVLAQQMSFGAGGRAAETVP